MPKKNPKDERIRELMEQLADETRRACLCNMALVFLAASVAKSKTTKRVYHTLKQLLFEFENSPDQDSVEYAMDKLCIAHQRAEKK